MSLAETYRPLYAELPTAELTKVGTFASAFLAARGSGDVALQRDLIKQAVAPLANDSEALDHLLGALHYAGLHGSLDEKVAVAQLTPFVRDAMRELDEAHRKTAALDGYQKTQIGMGMAGLGLAAAPFVGHLTHKMKRAGKIKQSLTQIMQEHPELRQNPHTPRYFQAVVDFAPDVAANSLVAGNVLKAMHQIGPGSVTPKMLSELLSVQKDYQSTTEPPKAVANFGEALSKTKLDLQ